jgi:hypothetical protein
LAIPQIGTREAVKIGQSELHLILCRIPVLFETLVYENIIKMTSPAGGEAIGAASALPLGRS